MTPFRKLAFTALFAILSLNLFGQFYSTDHENIMVFHEDSTITDRFSTTRMSWIFKVVNNKYTIVASEEYIKKNRNSILLFDEYNFKSVHSFDYDVKVDELARFENNVYFPIYNVDESWNVLCKLNMDSGEITYIPLPEQFRNLPCKDYDLDYFSFDKGTQKAHIFMANSELSFTSPLTVFTYDLKTGEFSQSSMVAYQHLGTANSYHYYWDHSWKLYCKNLSSPDSKPQKIALSGSLSFPIAISGSEIMFFRSKESKGVTSFPTKDQSNYGVLKDGVLMDIENGDYQSVFNSIKCKNQGKDFYFDYSETEGYQKKFTAFTNVYESHVLAPGIFLLVVLPSSAQNLYENNAPAEPDFEEEYEARIVNFMEQNNGTNILSLPDSWYGKCLAYEKCLTESFNCDELKNELRGSNLYDKLRECEYLLGVLTGTKKDYLEIRYGTTNYNNLKNDLIYIKSTIIRVQNKI
jgi:hypothetical protein